jgi:hypothetical protein
MWGRLPACGPIVYRSIRAQPGQVGQVPDLPSLNRDHQGADKR